jgi:K+-transporting ATPase KdpF subunit
MDHGDVRFGYVVNGTMFVIRQSVRKNIKEGRMIYVAAIIAVFLLVYLFVALIRPEWF